MKKFIKAVAVVIATTAILFLLTKINGQERPIQLKINLESPTIFAKPSDNPIEIVAGESRADAKSRAEQRLQAVTPENTQRPAQGTIKQKIYQSSLEQWSDEAEAEAVLWIVGNESGFNPDSKNGNCCGLFQRLNRCTDDIMINVDKQITEGLNYILERYGTPSKAKEFWQSHSWY